MKRTVDIQEFERSGASPEQLRALHELMVLEELEQFPEDPPAPFDEHMAWFDMEPSWTKKRYWLVEQESEPMAYGFLRTTHQEVNQHRGWINVFTRPEARRKGLASEALREAGEWAKSMGRTNLFNYVLKDSVGVGFAARVGAEKSTDEFENRLYIDELDRSLIHGWIDRAAERAGEYRLEFWDGPCPSEMLERFAQAKQAMNDAPRSENEEPEPFLPEEVKEYDERYQKAGFTIWTYAAVHQDSGAIGGYTQLFPSPWRPTMAAQEDTGVLPDHRNRGLGRWLKGAMLVRLLELRPETKVVVTWNATSNQAMLGINRELGFRPVRNWQEWDVDTDVMLKAISVGS